jgi:hypothetical protein
MISIDSAGKTNQRRACRAALPTVSITQAVSRGAVAKRPEDAPGA